MMRSGRAGWLVLSCGMLVHLAACSTSLRVELANRSGNAVVLDVTGATPVAIQPEGTGSFTYSSVAILTIRAGTACWAYRMPRELASSHDRHFVRPEGFMGRVARMELGKNGSVHLLTPEENSTRVSPKQPRGFPVRPDACDKLESALVRIPA